MGNVKLNGMSYSTLTSNEYISQVKSYPSYMGPYGGTDLHFYSAQLTL